MASEDLATIVDRAWALLPFARQAVSAGSEATCAVSSAGDLGRRFFPLATGFESCGQPIPARLVQGLAAAFTELGHQRLTPSDQVLDLLRTATSQLGDLLVELDATGEITIPEPIDTIILLEEAVARQRLVQQATTTSQRELSRAESNPWSDLQRCGDALFAASESLLNRVQLDDASPYSAPVSRKRAKPTLPAVKDAPNLMLPAFTTTTLYFRVEDRALVPPVEPSLDHKLVPCVNSLATK